VRAHGPQKTLQGVALLPAARWPQSLPVRAPQIDQRMLGAALASRRRWPRVLVALGAAAYAATPVRRGRARAVDGRERALATVAVPALMAFTDVAKMVGYAAGLVDRLRAGGTGGPRGPSGS